LKLQETDVLKKVRDKKNYTMLIGIYDPNYEYTWHSSLGQKIYSIMQSLRSATIISFNRPTQKL